MLTPGNHVCDLALLYPAYAAWAHMVPTSKPVSESVLSPGTVKVSNTLDAVSGRLLASQLDFDYLDDESLWQARLAKGALKVGQERYRVIVLPAADVLHARTAARLAAFIRNGGKVVCVDSLPQRLVSGTDPKSDQAALAYLRKHARRTPLERLPHTLYSLLKPDLRLLQRDHMIFYCHRRLGNTDLYFIVNNSHSFKDLRLRLRGHKQGELWDPLLVQRAPIQARRGVFSISMRPFSATFLLFPKP